MPDNVNFITKCHMQRMGGNIRKMAFLQMHKDAIRVTQYKAIFRQTKSNLDKTQSWFSAKLYPQKILQNKTSILIYIVHPRWQNEKSWVRARGKINEKNRGFARKLRKKFGGHEQW